MSARHFLITWDALKHQVPYCRQHVLRLEDKGEFPKRVQCSAGRVAWWQDEVDEFLASRTRGAPAQRKQLGPRPPRHELDPADLRLLRELAAKFGFDLVLPEPERREGGRTP